MKKNEIRALSEEEIEEYLSEGSFCKRVECHEWIDSTNTRIKELAEHNESEGTLVVAEGQSAGKGRRGRSWISESGVGIWMSFLLRPSIEPSKVSGITLLAALALVKAIREVCKVEAEIKWPNDIILGKKKICGILTEMSSESNKVHYVVVGIGMNANHEVLPDEIVAKASSLFLETGKKVDRNRLIAMIMNCFEDYYKIYQENGGLDSFVEEYNSILINRNQEVCILYGMVEDADPEKTEYGTAKGIDAEGALLVDTTNGRKRIVSGEVSVRGKDGYV